MTIRTTFLDPDNRRYAKTDLFCCRCNKDIKGSHRIVHLVAGGAQVLHPDDELAYVSDGGDLGAQAIGPDCARKLGLEWSRPA
jgi:hypothetical protein